MKNMNDPMKSINVYNLIILDESGSMQSIYSQAIDGINETLNTIRCNEEKHPEQHHFVSIVTFEGSGPRGVKVRRDRVPVGKIGNFTKEDYRPGGCTPLHDAVGISVSTLERDIEEGSSVFVTIITDGYENSSEEYSGSAVRSLIDRKRECGWTFAYIGATDDAVEIAHNMNINNAMRFSATGAGVVAMMDKLKVAYCEYADRLEESPNMPVSDLFKTEEGD